YIGIQSHTFSPRSIPQTRRNRPMDLFEHSTRARGEGVPLADRMRPRRLAEMVGQAHLIAAETAARFETLSAVLSGVAELRAAVKLAREQKQTYGKRTLLFVDEI